MRVLDLSRPGCNRSDIMTCKPTPIRYNLSRKKCKALAILRKRTDIVMKPADKGWNVYIGPLLVCERM